MRFTEYILSGFKVLDSSMDRSRNYQFIGFDKPESQPPADATMHHAVQAPVKHAMRKILLHNEFVHITTKFKRSTIDDSSITEAFFKGDLPYHKVPKDGSYQRALAATMQVFAPQVPIKPVHYCDLRYYPWKLRPSAELPFTDDPALFKRVQHAAERKQIPDKRMSFGNLYNHIFEYLRPIIHYIKNGPFHLPFKTSWPQDDYLTPMRSHARSAIQPISDPNKVRFVYGYPKVGIFPQAMFFWPLFVYYHITGQSPLLWGYETMTGGWYRLNHELRSTPGISGSILELDWQGFDIHALFEVFDDIKNLSWSFFDCSHGYQPTKDYQGTSCDPDRLKNLWEWIWFSIKYTPIRLPDGRLFRRSWRGVPSGLFITQWLDSVYNCIMIFTILDAMGFEITSDLIIKVLGDDSLTRLRLLIPYDQHEAFTIRFKHLAQYYFDAVLSDKKSRIHNTLNGVKCLGYRNNNGLPVRDRESLLTALLYPKARRPTFEQLKARCIGIAYASAGNDPTTLEVCKDVYDYLDAKGIKADPAGLADLFDPNLGLDIDITFFPNILTIQRSLLILRDSREQAHRMWPTSHFLSPIPGLVDI
ncbi:RNA-dependent RNA polymerase [Chondrostereum purpureum cryptic virus 1]|uniref:RNA-dependent RNA polymerase n=1 Tax=Chondrostereum purpureum cryptic virus 1 TaxID=529380 RepID=B7ZGY8_9VIRU|nr:RNA-dependent RNA polymerase [Chondrostereum purpureum cryptic virus 1]CAQ53729.1 RNA-dependent RNA polymerase [Chondrostereum purpureum cryptic virus 1]